MQLLQPASTLISKIFNKKNEIAYLQTCARRVRVWEWLALSFGKVRPIQALKIQVPILLKKTKPGLGSCNFGFNFVISSYYSPDLDAVPSHFFHFFSILLSELRLRGNPAFQAHKYLIVIYYSLVVVPFDAVSS